MRPEFEDIRTHLGVVYRDMKDYNKSVQILDEAVNLNPDYLNARVQLGITYFTMGQPERARTEWMKVITKDPNNKLASMYLNLLKKRIQSRKIKNPSPSAALKTRLLCPPIIMADSQ